MEYITTTHLRTKSSALVDMLKKGTDVSLMHRSRLIAVIKPAQSTEAPPINVNEFRRFLKSIKPKKIIPRSQREKVYREHLEKKYGKNLS